MFNDHENAFIWRATKQLKQLTVATSGRQRRLAEGANPQNEPVMADFLVQNGHLAVLAWLHETFSGLLLLNLLVRLKMSKQIGVNVTVSFRPASCGWRDVQPCPPFVTGVHPGEFLQRLRNSACAPATGCFHSTAKVANPGPESVKPATVCLQRSLKNPPLCGSLSARSRSQGQEQSRIPAALWCNLLNSKEGRNKTSWVMQQGT
ncbi:uncharacterized protein ACBT44_003431 isoform 2-T2 [Syngnathus typhle]